MTLSLNTIRYLIVDIDGVLWHGKQPLPGVPEFFAFLNSRGIRFIIATNNSARPISDITGRLARMGIHVEAGDVLTSAEATALYLPHIVPPGSRVLLVGGKGIAHALTHAGYQLADHDVAAVVVGVDFELTYDKLTRATLEIRRGAVFVGTNNDKTFPSDDGLTPGAGAIIAAVQTATDAQPILIGKPQRAMFDMAVQAMGGDPAATAMLGDRLDTDIEGAQRAGLKSILLLTGVTTSELLAQSSVKPDLVFQDLPALCEAWEKHDAIDFR